MKAYRSALSFVLAAGLLCFGGSGCQWLGSMCAPPAVRVLPPSPSLEQVVEVVNRNNSAIHSFSTTEARLSGPGFPSLNANLAFERPGLLRLRADSIVGPELDLGSNQELFWFWARRSQPEALYFCRHDQFAASSASRAVPINPSLLIEALGTREFDPALSHEGPVQLPGERLEIRTVRESPEGTTTKVTIVDGIRGLVLEQHIYNAAGQLVASFISDNHRRDPLSGLVMPGTLKLDFPSAQLSMRLDLGRVHINQLTGDPAELWSLPHYQGAPAIDLASPKFQPPPATAALRHTSSRNRLLR
jgi:hypothetical protein